MQRSWPRLKINTFLAGWTRYCRTNDLTLRGTWHGPLEKLDFAPMFQPMNWQARAVLMYAANHAATISAFREQVSSFGCFHQCRTPADWDYLHELYERYYMNPADFDSLEPALKERVLSVMDRAEKIKEGLIKSDPMLPLHCQNILATLQQYEELVHLLPDSVIHTFMAGMSKYKNIKLIEEAQKSRGRSKVTADDL